MSGQDDPVAMGICVDDIVEGVSDIADVVSDSAEGMSDNAEGVSDNFVTGVGDTAFYRADRVSIDGTGDGREHTYYFSVVEGPKCSTNLYSIFSKTLRPGLQPAKHCHTLLHLLRCPT